MADTFMVVWIGGIVAFAVACLTAFLCSVYVCCKKSLREGDVEVGPPHSEFSPSPGTGLGFSLRKFRYEELADATNGFSDANLLGKGGFGDVHRGVLSDGKEVAVKQLRLGNAQAQGDGGFKAEVEIISRVHHKHLVSLIGYCITETVRMLVYEFAPNNALGFHLHRSGRQMDWPTRLKIAVGAAKGLAYLHEDCHPKIVHMDVKPANILLDFNFEAKVADFGLAKFFPDENTHISTQRLMGTFGYMAPEVLSGRITEKSDVYSFGVVLLELITGYPPTSQTQSFLMGGLVIWAKPLLRQALEEGNYTPLIDRRLGSNYNHTEMTRMVACAAACVRQEPRSRPRLSQVVRALEGGVPLTDLNDEVRFTSDMIRIRNLAFGSSGYQSSSSASESGTTPSGFPAQEERALI